MELWPCIEEAAPEIMNGSVERENAKMSKDERERPSIRLQE